MIREYRVIFMFILFVSSVLSCVTSTFAATATIYGKVTEEDGTTPVASAEVRIRIMDYIAGVEDYVADFPWVTKKVYTDKNGEYQASIPFPEIIEICFYAEVIKTDVKPFKRGYIVKSFASAPPADGQEYELNIKLFSYSNSAVVQGYVKDKESGLPVCPGTVKVPLATTDGFLYFYTDSDGFYKGIIRDLDYIGDEPYQITLNPYSNEIKYADKSKTLSKVKAGKVYVNNFNLERDKECGYIVGTVTDEATSKPLPYARLVIDLADGMTYSGIHADFLGKYKRYADNEGSYRVSTTGVNAEDEEKSSYSRQEREVEVSSGEMVTVDFQMASK